jgi:hypothetical protein
MTSVYLFLPFLHLHGEGLRVKYKKRQVITIRRKVLLLALKIATQRAFDANLL